MEFPGAAFDAYRLTRLHGLADGDRGGGHVGVPAGDAGAVVDDDVVPCPRDPGAGMDDGAGGGRPSIAPQGPARSVPVCGPERTLLMEPNSAVTW